MIIISPEMLEQRRVISSMTSEKKRVYRWKYYDEKARSQLLELIDYCQSNKKICPSSQQWNKIYHVYSWHTDSREFTKFSPLKIPLILGAWNTSDLEKRQRFLTQIYWCYKNKFIGALYDRVMGLADDDWHFEHYSEDKISLELIKKEYARWLGVNCYPKHDIWSHCTDYYEKDKKIQVARALYKTQSDTLDDESITLVESR